MFKIVRFVLQCEFEVRLGQRSGFSTTSGASEYGKGFCQMKYLGNNLKHYC